MYFSGRGLVFAASLTNVYAFDARTPGPPVWTAGVGPDAVVEGLPALDAASETLYVTVRLNAGERRRELRAFDAGTGREKPAGTLADPLPERLDDGQVYWTSPAWGPLVYRWADGDVLKAWQVRGVDQSPVLRGLAPGKGAWLALSANEGTAGTGVVWALVSAGPESGMPEGSALLRAFDAADPSLELWNSERHPERDSLGAFSPAAPPTVAGGRVWVPAAGGLHVFGVGKNPVRAAAPALAAAAPASIGIKFVGTGVPMGPGEVAGVLPRKNWNNAQGVSSSSPKALVDENGAASGATVAWASQVAWHLPIADAPGDRRLMYGYIDSLGVTPTTVTVSNLPPSPDGYTVYVYTDGDSGASVRTGSYHVGAGPVTVTDSANFAGSFRQAENSAGNYVVFSIAGTGFTLTAAGASSTDRYLRAPVNAIQIVPSGSPDFALSVSPSSQAVTPGGSASYTVTVSPRFGFTGAVALSAAGLPAGASASFNPASVNGSGTATLTVSTTANIASGSTAFTITGLGGGLSHSAGATLAVNTVPGGVARSIGINFVGRGASLAPAEVAGVVPAANWNNASTSPLALVDETGTATGATLTWSSQAVWSLPVSTASGSARMMSGYLDTLGATPTTVTVAGLPQGSWDVYVYCDGDNQSTTRSGSYQIGGTALQCTDTGKVNFNGVFEQAQNYLRFTVSGTGFTLTATAAASDDAYLRAPLNGLQIVPASGAPVPDFSLAVSPSAGGVYNVAVTARNGFNSTVSLSASGLPAGATANFQPASITGSGTATLTITSPVSALFTVTAAGGGLSRSVQASYTPPVSAQPAVIGIDFVGTSTAMGSSELAGVAPRSRWNSAAGLAPSAPLALIDESGATTGATVTWSAQSLWKSPIATTAGDYRMMSGYIDSLGTTPTVVTVAGLPPNTYGYNVYVYADGDNTIVNRTGAYTIGGITRNLTDAAGSNFTGAYTEGKNYLTFFVSGTGFTLSAAPLSSGDAYKRAPVSGIQIVPAGPPDFSLSVQSASLNLTPGAGGAYALAIAARNGFTGPVTLAVGGLPGGVNATFTPASVTGSGSTTLTLATSSGSPQGDYNLTVTATGGGLTRTLPLTLGLHASLGMLNGTLWTPAGVYNLSALGTRDWAHWGYNFPSNYDHKAGVTPQISNVTVYNGEPGMLGFSSTAPGLSFSWSDGTPDRVVNGTMAGVRVMGVNKGLQFTAPADTVTRTLTVYLGAWNTVGKMVAHLTDGSAPDYVDTSISSPSMAVQTDAAYTFTYRAASPGQKLVITYTMISDTGPRCLAWEVYGAHCYVTLQGATLQ